MLTGSFGSSSLKNVSRTCNRFESTYKIYSRGGVSRVSIDTAIHSNETSPTKQRTTCFI